MINQVSIKQALNLSNSIFIDVRSEKEFQDSHIPNATNMPILTNEEREDVGKVYKLISKDKAKSLGMDYASKKLTNYYERIMELKRNYENIIFYCWRGGLRSQSICNILNTLNVKNVFQLKGGYKGYRRFVLNFLDENISTYTFVVLHGLTGVGKTIILQELNKNNIPTVDLEGYAKNAGSVFGNLLYPNQSPSQKQFESYLFNNLYYNNQQYVFIESESKRIGNINVPDVFIKSMENGLHILIQTSLYNRVENIYQSYIATKENNDDLVIKSIQHLKKRIGNTNVDSLTNKILVKDYKYVIEFLLNNYYDPLYKYSINKINDYDLVITYDHIHECIKKIHEFIDEKIYKEGSN